MLVAGSKRRLTLGLGAALSLATLLALSAGPVLADPSLGNWTAVSGDSYQINTTSLTLTGPGTSFTGLDDSGIATFTFGTVDIPSGATVSVTGTLPLEIVAQVSFALGGTISGSGVSATDFGNTVGGPLGGPGGGNGGSGGVNAGSGPGGGGASSTGTDGGGGGGFGGAGAAGGVDSSGTGGAGGATYGDVLTQLQGGSGGGGSSASSSPTEGGGGGGAIEIASLTGSITLSTGSVLSANGGSGAEAGQGASGGGSGGGILLEAYSIDNAGAVTVTGGNGGAGQCCGGGGAGGGGEIVAIYNSYAGAGSTTAAGGESYVEINGTASGSSTGTEPDPTGAAGQVLLESPSTTTTVTETPSSPSVGDTATLHASVTAAVGPVPTGSVVFSDSSGTLCTAALTPGVSSSTGSCTYRVRSGNDAVTATFDPTGPDASGTAAVTLSATVPVPTTGASSGELALPLGAAALVLGTLLLLLAGAVDRRRQPV